MGNFSSITKTPFHRRPKGGRGRIVLIFGAIALAALLLFNRPLGTLTSYAAAPIHGIAVWFKESTGTLPSYLRARQALINERDALKEELDNRAHDRERIAQLEHDNEALRSLMSVEEESRIAAGIVARPYQTPYDTLLIDQGSENGIQEGATVFAHGEVAIGSVIRAFPDSALVALFSTPKARSVVYIIGPDTFVTAEGQGGGVIKIGVPQGINIEVGNTIILPTIAPGIFGRIEYIESDESNPEQYGFATVAANISGLRFVAVDVRPRPEISYDGARSIVDSATALFATSSIAEFVSTTTPTSTASSSPE